MTNQPHPVEIMCPMCETYLRRSGSNVLNLVYSCFCGGTVRQVPKPSIKRSALRTRYNGWSGSPNDAA